MIAKKKILVIQTAFIGDVVLATPVLESLNSAFPDSHIDLLVKKGHQNLFENHLFLRNCFVIDKSKKMRSAFKLIKTFRKNKYDLIICLHRHFTAGFISILSGADKVFGFKKNPFSIFFDYKAEHMFCMGIHEVDRNLSVIKPLQIEAKRQPVLYPSDYDFQFVLKYKSTPYICIAPASIWFTKRYPEDLWVELINSMPTNYQIYLLGSPSDMDLCESIVSASKNENLLSLAGSFSMLQSAALMKDAVMNYVNDSAPLHFSSAMNARVTAIYCSTVPEFGFGPLGSNTYIVEIREKIDCRPCGIHGHNACPKSHFNCAKKIKLDDLLKPIL